MERGNKLLEEGKYADAELLYRKSIAKNPRFAEGYYRLGLLEHRLRRGNEALEDLQRAVNFDPGNDRYGIQLAGISIEAYQAVPSRKILYEQAAHEADVLLKKEPNGFDGHRLRADVLVLDRRYDDALLEFRKANAIRPNDPDVVLAMSQLLFAQNRGQEGEDLVRRFLAVRQDFPQIYGLLVTQYLRAKRFAEAEHLLQSEIAALPKDIGARFQLASLYRDSGRDREMSQVLANIVKEGAAFPDGRALVGDFYAASHKWDDALIQYRAGIQASPRKDIYHKRMERALEALGKREEALGEVNEILHTNPKDPDARLTRAILLRQSQNAKERDSANEDLKTLAAEYPQNAVVRYNLGLSYWNRGDSGAAWKELKKSSDLRKDYIAPRLLLADIAQTAHNYPAALQAADEALALDPNNADAKLLRAAALVGNKSYRQARSELKALSELQPNSKEIGLQAAALAVAEKDYPKAERLYRRFYETGSKDLRPLEGLLQVCILERHPEKAQTILESELKHDPESRPVRLLLASVATQQGKFDLAAQQYRWLQSKNPNSAQAYSALGDLYLRQGATQDALASYEKANQLAPADTRVLNAIAVLESNNGQQQQAIAALDKQLALDPNNATAMNNLAFNLAESGRDLDRALALAGAVARKFPNDPGVIDTLGWVYAKRGLNPSAIQVLRGLVKKYPNEPAYRYHLAVALLQDHQTSDAKREFLASLSAHPPRELSSKIQASLAQVR